MYMKQIFNSAPFFFPCKAKIIPAPENKKGNTLNQYKNACIMLHKISINNIIQHSGIHSRLHGHIDRYSGINYLAPQNLYQQHK